MRKFRALVLLLLAALTSFSQGTDASIEVSVSLNKNPLQGATIALVNTSTGFKTTGVSQKSGVFRFDQLPLGGPYQITVTFVGLEPVTVDGYTLNQGSTLKIPVSLSEQAAELQTVVVTSNEFRNRNERLGQSTLVNSRDIQKLPTTNRNFSNLAQLSPMVGNSFNIGGINSRNDAFTVDGVTAKESSFGGPDQLPYTFSIEAVREFEVVTNSYDVTEGRSIAGGIRSVTKSGTNEFHGSAFTYFWDARLAANKDLLGRNVINDTKKQMGFTLGGPIVRNKAHFFIAYDGERLDQAYDLWAQSVTPGIVQNNRGQLATQANLDRAIAILQEKYGVSKTRQYGFFTRTNKLNTFFGKVDYQLNDKNKLTIRYNQSDYILPNNNNSDIGAQGIKDTGYDFIVKGKNGLVALRTQFRNNVSNDLKLGYYFNTRQNAINTGEHPQLWLTMQSVINGATQNATLVGRYNRWTPEVQENTIFTINNDVYVNKGNYNFVFGTQNTITRSSGVYTHDTKGRFDFNSIDALEKMQPDRYQRKYTNPGQELRDPLDADLAELAVYAQATTNVRPNLKLSAGLRYDVALFFTAPDYNATLDKELGYRNDIKPKDLNNIQPRFNFNWDVKGNQQDIVAGGFGFFAGQMVTRPYIYALIDNGIRFTGVDIRGRDGFIINPATNDFLIRNGQRVPMPVPNYSEYDKNYSAIPGAGLTNAELFGAGNQAQVVRFVDQNLQLPNSFKAHLSFHHYFTPWLRAGVMGYYIKTRNMLTMENVNINKVVQFNLEGEGGREVYTPLNKMTSNSADFNSAKRSTQFTEALMYTNGYSTDARGVVLDAAIRLPKEGSVNMSYTRAKARGAENFRNEDDQRFVGASYFDNYNFINSSFSPNDFRQKILFNVSSPKVGGFTIGAYLTMVEMGRFSAIITPREVMGTNIRDQNGNTAYIFDPNDPKTLQFQGQKFVDDLKFVLQNAGPAAQKYLNENMGKYAEPYGGLMGWRSQLNARITNDIAIYKNQRLQLNFDVFNALNLIDPSKGGFWNYPFQELYRITSFNAATKSYRYEINRNYGQRRKEGSGFVVMFGVKYVF
ncbi:MAG TPA: carboxypeptidase regulatory-like domain-containing protein [Flavisolibacter sp.]|nr:carboxypeptidase regulatory-like domain-containing protein [Flavisolibacter sp.]